MATELRGRLRGAGPYLLLAAVLLLASVGMWAHAWLTGDPRTTIPCGCGDPGINLWTIQWAAWSVTHLHNPFLTAAVYAGQGGANVLDTYNLLPGLLALPLTLAFGPVLSFNVLVTLVPVVNGLAMFALLRRVTGYLPGDMLASAIYAFVPFFVDNEQAAHFNADVAFLPPLLLLFTYDLLVEHRHRPIRIGLLAGVLAALQFFVGPEQLATCAVMALVGLLIGAAAAPRLLWQARSRLLQAGGAAAGVAAIALAYPAWVLLAGPRHTSGPVWPDTPATSNVASGLVDPGPYGAHSVLNNVGGYFGPQGPAEPYIGIAMLVVVALSAALWWRRRLARCALVGGTAAFLLSLGIGPGYPASHWLPWRIFYRLPVMQEILPLRFVLFTDMAIILLLAISLRAWWERRYLLLARVRRLGRGGRRRFELAWGTAGCAAVAAAFVPVLVTEGLPMTERPISVPAWFRDVAPRLPSRPTLLVLPDATSGNSAAMGWQAESDFSFSMVGGYAVVPGPDGHTSMAIDHFTGVTELLENLSYGFEPPPDPSAAETSLVRSSLAAWGVQVVVITRKTRSPAFDAEFFTAVLGRLPRWEDGAWVWYGLGRDPPFGLPRSTLLRCFFSAGSAPMAGPRCVLAAAKGARAP